ncbi:MAG: (d)CMP kinase [Oligoflexales bacterium]
MLLPSSEKENGKGDLSMTPKPAVIVAVDGPAGSGKSSICRQVCKKIGFVYINTGAIYRALGFIAKRMNIDLANEQQLGNLVTIFKEGLEWDAKSGCLFFEGENLSPHLYDEQVGSFASKIAKNPKLRNLLLPLQRKLAESAPNGALLDGRDIGTVVFPNADLKIFMTASLEQRAKRRLLQLQEQASPSEQIPNHHEIMLEIEKRDSQDKYRGTAPLKKSPEAIEFDTSDLGIEESILEMTELIKNKLKLL